MNWERTRALKKEGGLGIIDIADQNVALLIKWLWKLHHDSNGLWAQTLLSLYGLSHHWDLGTQGSYFLKALTEFRDFFDCSISSDQERVRWKWTEGEGFSTASAYKTLHTKGMNCQFHRVLWKIKIPLKVKVLCWLLINDRILTKENLQKRGCSVEGVRVMCINNALESTYHLFWECTAAYVFWWGFLASINLPIPAGNGATEEIWWEHRKFLQGALRKSWDEAWALGVWTL
ncbi:uncharacterized protein LOC144547180 [Carex rostrata]